MNKLVRWCVLLGVVSACAAPTKEQLAHARKKMTLEIPIRVLLKEDAVQNCTWQLGSDAGFMIYMPASKKKHIIGQQAIAVSYKQDVFCVGSYKVPEDHFFITPLTGLLCSDTTPYDGIFAVTKMGSTAFLVNHLDLEEYLQSVLPYESYPGWPEEVQKVFSITFRTYGISKILEQRSKGEQKVPYDIKNTNTHQVYKGRKARVCFKKIVESTKGIVLAHNKKPIVAMFDTACGGVIPAQVGGIHFEKAPYLERRYPCHFCKENAFYRWDTTYTFAELEKGLKNLIPNFGNLREIKIGSTDSAGVAQTVRVRGSRGWHTVKASTFRSQFKKLRSLNFAFSRSGKEIAITGKGYGHHMGLCQWGAYCMVKSGWDYKQILQFYYPNTSFMKLTKGAHVDV